MADAVDGTPRTQAKALVQLQAQATLQGMEFDAVEALVRQAKGIVDALAERIAQDGQRLTERRKVSQAYTSLCGLSFFLRLCASLCLSVYLRVPMCVSLLFFCSGIDSFDLR